MTERHILDAAACPDAATHTPCPADYLAWHAWAETMAETHTQRQCRACGLWVVWIPKPSGVTVTDDILDDVRTERARQDAKWGVQNHPDGTGRPGDYGDAVLAQRACDIAADNGTLTYRHILEEEVAEAFAESDPARLEAELVQVAAVAVAWIEKLRWARGGGS